MRIQFAFVPALASALLLPFAAAAQAGEAFLDLSQRGDKNVAEVYQQQGAGSLSVKQQGNAALGKVYQGSGSGNQLMLEQVNSPESSAELVQWGSNNQQSVLQDSSPGARIHTWQGHSALAANDSALTVTQRASANANIMAIQEGNANNAEILQENSAGSSIQLYRQSGDRNTAKLTQSGAPSSDIMANQSGNDNLLEVSQRDGRYLAWVDQTGNGNSAKVDQGFSATKR